MGMRRREGMGIGVMSMRIDHRVMRRLGLGVSIKDRLDGPFRSQWEGYLGLGQGGQGIEGAMAF